MLLETKHSKLSALPNICGYTLFQCTREKKKGGGIMMFIDQNQFPDACIFQDKKPGAINEDELFIMLSWGKTAICVAAIYLRLVSSALDSVEKTERIDSITEVLCSLNEMRIPPLLSQTQMKNRQRRVWVF